jgi:hypothetical protein
MDITATGTYSYHPFRLHQHIGGSELKARVDNAMDGGPEVYRRVHRPDKNIITSACDLNSLCATQTTHVGIPVA